jgi:hypothetical protein
VADRVRVLSDPTTCEGALRYDDEPIARRTIDCRLHQRTTEPLTGQLLRYTGVDEDQSVGVEAIGQLRQVPVDGDLEATGPGVVHDGRAGRHCW